MLKTVTQAEKVLKTALNVGLGSKYYLAASGAPSYYYYPVWNAHVVILTQQPWNEERPKCSFEKIYENSTVKILKVNNYKNTQKKDLEPK